MKQASFCHCQQTANFRLDARWAINGQGFSHAALAHPGACSAALADAVPQLSLGHRDGRAAAWRQRPGRHLCRARRKRSNDSDTDDEENEEVSVRDSRDPDLEDDDDDEEEGGGLPVTADPREG